MEREYPTYLSKRLYQYLCDTIGSEKVVKLRRLYYSVVDYFLEGKYTTHISSGSMGEGLNMPGSDVDIMEVLNFICVTEKTTGATPVEMFIMETERTKPGYTLLRMNKYGKIKELQFPDFRIEQWCTMIGDSLYLSSEIFKEWCLAMESHGSLGRRYIHGPCITDEYDALDHAFCLKCEEWVEQAQPWATRSRYWPSSESVSRITSYGVLLVPIGCKGSRNESIEWRISFSVAEKHLIYSFSHTQFLCYALLKILLKEIIEKHTILKGLLCSYFLKTTIFWVSEELPASVWIPENFFNCFSECYKRLIYAITYRNLPHFFITENNLFENRFDDIQYSCLLAVLSQRYDKGIFGLAESQMLSRYFSDPVYAPENNITDFFDIINNFYRISYGNRGELDAVHLGGEKLLFDRLMLKTKHFASWRLFYKFCQIYAKYILEEQGSHNKDNYHTKNKYFPFLILGTNTDAVSGWLYVASYYHNMKQFSTALEIIHFVLDRCSRDKVHSIYENITLEHLDITEKRKLQDNKLRRESIFKRHMIDIVLFNMHSTLIPRELKPELTKKEILNIPPVVYAYFLKFLCWFNLQDKDQCIHAINALVRTMNNWYFICYRDSMGHSLTCLGIAYSMNDAKDDAQWCFKKAKIFCPD